MSCSSHVVKTTYPNGHVTLELHCYGKCEDKLPCEPHWYNPNGSQEELFRTCFCQDELIQGPCCTIEEGPLGVKARTFALKSCRIALAYRYQKNGRAEAEPFGVKCVGRCGEPGTEGKCKPVTVGSTAFDGITIEVLRCRCE
jgi:hypothetical protein